MHRCWVTKICPVKKTKHVCTLLSHETQTWQWSNNITNMFIPVGKCIIAEIFCTKIHFDIRQTLSTCWQPLDFSCTEQMKTTLSSTQQDEEKSVRRRRKFTSDSNTSEVSDCWQRATGGVKGEEQGTSHGSINCQGQVDVTLSPCNF